MQEGNNSSILPEDTAVALRQMILLSKDMHDAYEQENNAIALGGELDFLNSTAAKQSLSALYQRASYEFLERRDEFKTHGGPLLAELATLQQSLKTIAAINMSLLGPLCEKLKEQHRSQISK